MAKFNFRLESYLNVKTKLENQKEMEYGKAIIKLEEEKKIKILLGKKMEKIISDLKLEIKIKIDGRKIKTFKDYHVAIKKKYILQDEKIEIAKKIAEEKRKELVIVMQERKMIEKLKEKDYEKFLKEESIAEQKMIDGVVSYQYNNKKNN